METENADMNIQDCVLMEFNDHSCSKLSFGETRKLPSLPVAGAMISVLMHLHSS